MRIIICGDRNWTNIKVIEDFILTLPKDTVVIEGECRGADQLSGYVAKRHGLEVIPVPAEWKKYGKAAGPIRNKRMLDEYKPDLVVAFHNHIEDSKGTADMISQAKIAGVEFKVIKETDVAK
jgi:hypothetical protein